MESQEVIKIFNNKDIRTLWDEEKEEYYFSIVDVVGILSESKIPRRYWTDLKRKLSEEGNETYENIVQLKMKAPDGKMRFTDVADTRQLLRLIQSIPSKNAEPFKLWLAEVGNDRVNETFDPELAIHRAIETYRKKGYSDEWIDQRLRTMDTRNELTYEWKKHDVKSEAEFAILTNEIYKTWSGYTAKEYKKIKRLTKGNLRDNMTNTERALNNLAEATTIEFARKNNPIGLEENKTIAVKASKIVRIARDSIEEELGEGIISRGDYKKNLVDKK